MRRHFLALVALTLAACGPSSEQFGQDDPDAPPVAAPSSAPRLYDPLSKTADAFTGALEITELPRPGPNATEQIKITAGMGHVWEAEFIGTAMLSDKVGNATWASLFPTAEKAPVTIYSINKETIKPDMLNGGPCEKTGFFAITEYTGVSGEGEMQLAAFSGDAWPPAADKDPPLCGTFSYLARK
jgi:hypothetical protein